nr:transposase, MuDR, MULE transposase domain protein [Tanacetum cinerariifolium]
MNRGSILHEDLTYVMLHEMVMKKFNLEAIYPLNLSDKVSSINDNFDITDDHEVQFFVECASKDELAHLPSNNITNTSFDNNGLDLNIGTSHFHNNESNHQNESHFEKPQCSFAFGDYHEYEDEKNEFDDVIDEKPVPNFQKWQKYMSFKPDILETPLYESKPMISKDYKKETDVKVGKNFYKKEDLDLSIRLKALDEGYQLLNDRSALERHAAIALEVQDEFPLSYHAVCCRHLMMNPSLKRDKTKALFWRICKAYTTEEFSRSMSHLQDIQTDAYDKLCQVGPQRWSRAHCPLVRYNYLTSNSVESVNVTGDFSPLLTLKLFKQYINIPFK